MLSRSQQEAFGPSGETVRFIIARVNSRKRCIIIFSTQSLCKQRVPPPYTSSMQTIPSPDLSKWVMVTVAASPDATAMPAGGEWGVGGDPGYASSQYRNECKVISLCGKYACRDYVSVTYKLSYLQYFAPSKAATAISRQFLVGFPLRLYSYPCN